MTGLYKHSKTGNHYRVLFAAQWWWLSPCENGTPDQEVGVYVLSNGRIGLWPVSQEYGQQHAILVARWSGNKPLAEDDDRRCVVYVALYGDGRVSVRSVKEFTEIVSVDGKDVPRFVRVGD